MILVPEPISLFVQCSLLLLLEATIPSPLEKETELLLNYVEECGDPKQGVQPMLYIWIHLTASRPISAARAAEMSLDSIRTRLRWSLSAAQRIKLLIRLVREGFKVKQADFGPVAREKPVV
jgi:hypothetical protein